MNAALRDIVERLSVQIGAGARSGLRIERIDVARRGGWILTVQVHGERRWFTVGADAAIELTPETDAALPISDGLADLGQRYPVRLLAWRPGRRLVLRVGRPGSTIIMKGYRRGRLESALQRHEVATQAAARSWLRVPSIVGWSDAGAFFSMADYGDRPLELRAARARDFAQLGHALTEFRSCKTDVELAQHGPAEVLAELDGLRARFAPANELVDPLPAEWFELRGALEEQAQRLPAVATRLLHRDLHDGQLIALTRSMGLLDFDLLSRGDSLVDVVNLSVHLELRALQGHGGVSADHMLELSSSLLEAASTPQGEGYDERFSFYRAATLLRLALVYRMRPIWADLVPVLTHKAALCAGELHDSA